MPERPPVLLIGAGGLGSPLALTLTARGVPLTLVDGDRVELSNLHRQLLHSDARLGQRKVDSALAALRRVAPAAQLEAIVEPIAEPLTPDNAAALCRGRALILEGSDSLPTKFLVNDTALCLGVPALIGGVLRFRGQLMTVVPGRACYRCLFEAPPPQAPSCQAVGVLGPACGVVAALQAAEALRILAGHPPRHAGAILDLDLLTGAFRRVPLRPRPGCPACAAAAAV